MKKALCFFMAVVFVCCVITHGKNERFSIEAMITNITKFEDMPTFEDIVMVWNDNYEWDSAAINLPYRSGYYMIPPTYDIIDGVIVQTGSGLYFDFPYPIAIDIRGNDISNQFPHLEVIYKYVGYNSIGIPLPFTLADGTEIYGELPFLVGAVTPYETYNGDNPVLEFFDNIKSFFMRVGNTASLIVGMVKSVFSNVKYLLPWNNTVSREEW